MTRRRLFSLAALLALLLNVSGVAMLAHERSAHHEFAGHDDAHCVVCQAVAAARTAAPPPAAPSVVTTTPTPRWTADVEPVAPYARDLPTSLTARGPPAA